MNKAIYRLNLTGKSLGEVYTLSLPDNLIKFISYDFVPFMEKCVELCRSSMKKGTIDFDEVSTIRSSIIPCHKYFEKNIRGIFDKIVIDCWIDYICRQNEINSSTLWNSFSGYRNEFEKVLFSRLCEFRYNHSINQWVNLLKIQEYALKKTEFIFGKRLDSNATAVAKAGYFDLLFNVAANEMGHTDLSTNRMYSALRTPNSPFIMSGISREIMRNILFGLRVEEEGTDGSPEGHPRRAEYTSDKSAMEAFTAIKNIIPDEPDTIISTIMKSIPRKPQRVYIPESFKAVIDLEIDTLLESGAVIQKCGRCLGYYLKDENYNYEYCSRIENYRSCLEIMGEKAASMQSAVSAIDAAVLQGRCDQLYKEMAERVNVDMNQRDFSDWYKYMSLIRENVLMGSASMDDFENFADYSRTINFSAKATVRLKKDKKKSDITFDEAGREIKSFEFERVDKKPTAKTETSPQTMADLYGINTKAFEPPPFAPPNTARIIRGVVPVGVKELPQPELVIPHTLPPVEIPVEPVGIEQEEAVAELSEIAEIAETIEEAEVDLPEIAEQEFVPVYSKSDFVQAPKPELINPLLQVPEPVPEPEPEPETKVEIKLDDVFKFNVDEEDNKEEKIKPEAKSEEESEQDFVKDEEVSVETAPSAPQLDFNSILSGIQRNDGFVAGDSEEDKEEPPVSHKTKRVMDAIFGKNKIVNPFVKQEEQQEQEQDSETQD